MVKDCQNWSNNVNTTGESSRSATSVTQPLPTLLCCGPGDSTKQGTPHGHSSLPHGHSSLPHGHSSLPHGHSSLQPPSDDSILYFGPGLNAKFPTEKFGERLQTQMSWSKSSDIIGAYVQCWSWKLPCTLGRVCCAHDMEWSENTSLLEDNNYHVDLFLLFTAHQLQEATIGQQRPASSFLTNCSCQTKTIGQQRPASSFLTNCSCQTKTIGQQRPASSFLTNCSCQTKGQCDDQYTLLCSHSSRNKSRHEVTKVLDFPGTCYLFSSPPTCDSNGSTSNNEIPQSEQMDLPELVKLLPCQTYNSSKLAVGNLKSTENLKSDEDILTVHALSIGGFLVVKQTSHLEQQHQCRALDIHQITCHDFCNIIYSVTKSNIGYFKENSMPVKTNFSGYNPGETLFSSREPLQREPSVYQTYHSDLPDHSCVSGHIRNLNIRFEKLTSSLHCNCDFISDTAIISKHNLLKGKRLSETSSKGLQGALTSHFRTGTTLTEAILATENVHRSLKKYLQGEKNSANTYTDCRHIKLGNVTPYHCSIEVHSQSLVLLSSLLPEHHHLYSPRSSVTEINRSSRSEPAPFPSTSRLLTPTSPAGHSSHQKPGPSTSQSDIGQSTVHPWSDGQTSLHTTYQDQGITKTSGQYHTAPSNITRPRPKSKSSAKISNSHPSKRGDHFQPVILFQLCALWLLSVCFPETPKAAISGHTLGKARRLRRSCLPLAVFYVTLVFGLSSVSAQGLVGTISLCNNEGESVTVPGITDDPCISCFCKNGQVKCEKPTCPKLEGCHAILYGQQSRFCCQVCKGCKYKGKLYESGHSWLDPKNSCIRLSCRAGVVTISEVQCFVPCHASLAPVYGQCCPRCEGCYFGGKTYSEGEKFQLPSDSCTTCTCQDSHLVCERRQCPVLNCPPEVIYQPDNECCPMCRGTREVFDVRSKCYFAKQLYRRHQKFSPEKCSECVCKSSTSVCTTTTCPALNCPEEDRIPLPGSECCQVCVEKRTCQFAGETYKNREDWRPNICMACTCEDGQTYCTREKCNNSLWCPPGYKLMLSRHECCPRCIEHDAVCSVFGDPHYRTFDGLTYSFQGTCKYVLAQSCTSKKHSTITSRNNRRTKPKTSPKAVFYRAKKGRRRKKKKKKKKRKDDDYFMIKVRNDVRFSSGFAWTQMLVILLAGHRISMLQGGVIKVDRRKVRRVPYAEPGKFTLTRQGGLVKLRTTIGLKVSWDGDSFVEVTVTTRLKFKVCGLCGSYNGVKADDLQGPDGKMYATGQEMGHAWRVGGTRACQSRPLLTAPEPLCEHDAQARLRAHRVCSVFYGRAFSKCRSVVDVDVYASSCITDMCDCPSGRYCACEAIRAYTSQCSRAGSRVKWDSLTEFCQISPECPSDARLVDCAETCPGTCERAGSDIPCPGHCIDACWCRDRSEVFHEGRCIRPTQCPVSVTPG